MNDFSRHIKSISFNCNRFFKQSGSALEGHHLICYNNIFGINEYIVNLVLYAPGASD